MLTFNADHAKSILCLGAHADDIEIGCSATILHLLSRRNIREVTWVVLSADESREREARASAASLLGTTVRTDVRIHRFRDGHFPFDGAAIKAAFEDLKKQVNPDLVFTHLLEDRHQDHRAVAELTWNTFRDHAILEYEIPKYDGNVWTPNLYVPLDEAAWRGKVRHLLAHFPSQSAKRWYTEDTFRATMRLRGVECACESGFAEAFVARKIVIR